MKTKVNLKKVLAVVLMLTLAVGMLPVNAQAKTKGYKFKYKKVTVYMDGPAKKLIKKAGKPKSKKVAKSCISKSGKDYTYKYKDFILYTYTKTAKGAQYISGITFLTSKVSTKEGIHIGSTFADAKKKYGSGTDNFGVRTYKKGKSRLQLEITDDEVTNIRYSLKS